MRFVPAPWSDDAKEKLAKCYDRNGWNYLLEEILEKDVKSGNSTLYEARLNGDVVGYIVAHVEISNGVKEFVLAAAAMDTKNSVNTYLPAWMNVARKIGCKKFRLHCNKRGMWRMFEKHDFDNVERVYYKELD